MFNRLISAVLSSVIVAGVALPAYAGRCNYPDDLDSAGRRCGGRAASERPGGYEPPPRQSYPAPDSAPSHRSESSIPGWVYLTASDSQAHINVRTSPSTSASAPSYGVVGDRVWASRTEQAEGYTWYFVGFPKTKVSGWIRSDLVRLP